MKTNILALALVGLTAVQAVPVAPADTNVQPRTVDQDDRFVDWGFSPSQNWGEKKRDTTDRVDAPSWWPDWGRKKRDTTDAVDAPSWWPDWGRKKRDTTDQVDAPSWWPDWGRKKRDDVDNIDTPRQWPDWDKRDEESSK